jgi:hypothetical protein
MPLRDYRGFPELGVNNNMNFLRALGAIAAGMGEGQNEKQQRDFLERQRAFQEEKQARDRQQWIAEDMLRPRRIQEELAKHDLEAKQREQKMVDLEPAMSPKFNLTGLPGAELLNSLQRSFGITQPDPSGMTVGQKRNLDLFSEKLDQRNKSSLDRQEQGKSLQFLLEGFRENARRARLGLDPIAWDPESMPEQYRSILAQSAEIPPAEKKAKPGPKSLMEKVAETTALTKARTAAKLSSKGAASVSDAEKNILQGELAALKRQRAAGDISDQEFRKRVYALYPNEDAAAKEAAVRERLGRAMNPALRAGLERKIAP